MTSTKRGKPTAVPLQLRDYAENTMNELLGWYGYDKVDSRDTQGLNLHHFTAATSPLSSSTADGSGSEDASRDVTISHPCASRSPTGGSASNGMGSRGSPKSEGSSASNDPLALQQQQLVSALSMLPKAPDSPNLPPGCIVCAWCQKVGMKLFTLKTSTGCKAFCSELCFTQCRRASFKKNKICDWCKHVRHTVNYVDFQDGEQQLQFCSDKCLNQYKMNIFCKETQAHLQLHPHLQEAASKMASSSSVNLITPDLWLRECKGDNATNGHSHGCGGGSGNGGGGGSSSVEDDREEALSLTSSDKPPSGTSAGSGSVMASPVSNAVTALTIPREDKDLSTKPARTWKERDKPRRQGRMSSRHATSVKERTTSESPTHHRHSARSPPTTGTSTPTNPPTTTTSHIPRINGPSPSLSSTPLGSSAHSQGPHPAHPFPPPLNLGPDPLRPPFLPPGVYPPPLNLLAQQQMEAFFRMHHGIGLRPNAPHLPFPPGMPPPFPPMPPVSVPGPLPTGPPSQSAQNQPPPPIPPPSLLPPVTVVVPYPIFLPIPIPIPLFLPISPRFLNKDLPNQTANAASDDNGSVYGDAAAGHQGRDGCPSGAASSEHKRSGRYASDHRSHHQQGNTKRVNSVITKLVSAQMDKCGGMYRGGAHKVEYAGTSHSSDHSPTDLSSADKKVTNHHLASSDRAVVDDDRVSNCHDYDSGSDNSSGLHNIADDDSLDSPSPVDSHPVHEANPFSFRNMAGHLSPSMRSMAPSSDMPLDVTSSSRKRTANETQSSGEDASKRRCFRGRINSGLL